MPDDEDKEERINDILEDLDKDVEMPPYDTSDKDSYSRAYKEFKEETEHSKSKNRYERLCNLYANIFHLKADESVQESLNDPIKLLGWNITPGMVLSASVGVFLTGTLFWTLIFLINMLVGIIPVTVMILFLSVPLTAGAYTYLKPKYAAKNKVIRSSGEMILAILYMVVYMRSSPNLEGGVRFAALNLEGPISKDLKGILWDLEVGNYNRIEEAMEDYTRRWKGYNDDFLESLTLLKAAMQEPGQDRMERMLQDSIDNILDGTREKMKHYAQSLETPVMIINAMGAMLPVLGMIMLPLITAFMGGLITPVHLFVMFNILLPGFLYWFMQRTLSSRPPTVSTEPIDEDTLPERGKYRIDILGFSGKIPVWPIGLLLFLAFGLYGIAGYAYFPHTYPVSSNTTIQAAPPLFKASADKLAPMPMLMRSLSLVFGLGLGIGVTKYLGNVNRRDAEEKLENIEQQFPNALFELGNKISGGTPIEKGLEEAAESTSELEISDLFREASQNVREMGMTFEESIFHDEYGAIRDFPSQMIRTVMKAVIESSKKGTNMASTAMMTISKYLKNIHKTQEDLNDYMEDTITTIQMLAYLLAPIVSGVAVGMSQTIIRALYTLGQSFSGATGNLQTGAPTGLPTGLGAADSVIPPEVLQLVVGLYLIQLLYILGTFYMKITHGEDDTYKNLFVGKVMISGVFFYTMTVIIVSLLFGGIVGGISG
ncbi:MAG: hypothetical protein ABEK01_03650 [Candidatus Nanohaloarchaea archaeon]